MNIKRKSKLEKVIEKMRENVDELQEILDEEQEYNGNIPDNLRESERAEASSEAIDTLTDAVMSIELVCDDLDEIVEK